MIHYSSIESLVPKNGGQHGLSFNGAWQLQVPISFLWIREAGSIVALGLMRADSCVDARGQVANF